MILAIDTSSVRGSLALIKKENSTHSLVNDVCWSKTLDKKSSGKHSEIILSQLIQLLDQANVKTEELTGLCVGVGPGRFTGIRVGLCLANTLAYSLDIPITSADSLGLLAAPVLKKETNCVCLVNAFKNQCFYKSFANQVESEIKSVTISQLDEIIVEDTICVGDGYKVYEHDMTERLKKRLLRVENLEDYPKARNFVSLLNTHSNLIKKTDWKTNKALYIRASEAEEKLWKGMLKLPEIII